MKQILKVPSSQGCLGKNIGCETAPDKICEHIENNFSIYSVDVDNMNIETTNKNIFDKVRGFNGIIIGGDHSITYSAVRALASDYKRVGFVMMDAHVDCTSYIKPPSHEDFLRVLIEDRVINKKDILVMGARKIYDAEEKYLKGKNICIVSTKNIMEYKNELKIFRGLDAVYLSIDIDVFDPKIVMGTGYKEKKGISKKTMFLIFKYMKGMKNLKIVDVVEVNPKMDKNEKTVKLAAGIVDIFYK